MKRFIIFLTAAFVLSCSGEELHIRGRIANLPDQPLKLMVYDEGGVRAVDVTQSRGGTFSFDLPEILPDILYISFDKMDRFFIPVIIEGASVNITGDMVRPENILITGSPANRELAAYRNSVRRNEMMIRAIEARSEWLSPHSVSAIEERKALVLKHDSLTALTERAKREFISSNPSSIVSAYLATTLFSDSTSAEHIFRMLAAFDPAMKDNVFLRRLKRAVQ